MALKYLIPIDLNSNEIRNIVVHLLGSDPGSPTEGQIWYNTTGHTLKLRLASSTVDLQNPTLLNGQAGSFYLSRANHTGTQLASTISDFDTQVRTSRLDQMATPTNDVSWGNKKITNQADPTLPQDSATKNYVDGVAAGGVYWKNPVRVLVTTNITISNPGTAVFDGVTLTTGNRVALVGQTSAPENGIYVFNGSGVAMTRSSDADTSGEVVSGIAFWVNEGTTNADTAWTLTTNDPITLGTTSLTFVQFSGLGQITSGAGLTKSGNTLNVGAGTGITVNADDVAITIPVAVSSGGTGLVTTGANTAFSNVTGVSAAPSWNALAALTETDDTNVTLALGGTPATALFKSVSMTLGWTGTLAVARGGTGSGTAGGARTNLGATGKYSANIGNGASTAITVTAATHGLGAVQSLIAQAYEVSSNQLIMCDITIAATGDVTFTFAVAPASNAIRIVIIG